MYAPKLGPVWKVSCFLADLGVANLNSSWYFQYVTVKVQDVTPPQKFLYEMLTCVLTRNKDGTTMNV